MRHIDLEMMDHIRERAERIKDYTPAEEFDATTALMLARKEIAPCYSGEEGANGN